MSTEVAAERPAADAGVAPSDPVGSASGSGLRTRLLWRFALIVILTAGSALALSFFAGRRQVQETLRSSLVRSQSVHQRVLESRLDQLGLIARIFASDPNVVSFLQESIDRGSAVSILDLLAEYQVDLGFDFAMVLDYEGMLVCRTDHQEASGEDLSGLPLVEGAFEEGSAAGIWSEPGDLLLAVAVPIAQQFDLVGFLLTGYRVDDALVRATAELTTSEVVYVAGTGGLQEIVASTLEPRQTTELAAWLGIFSSSQTEGEIELEIDGDPWVGLSLPLLDVSGERVGSRLVLDSVRRNTVNQRRLERSLFALASISVLVALLLASALAAGITRPIERLVEAIEAARRGDYGGVSIRGGSREFRRMAAAVRGLLAELREKREMETFVAHLTRHIPESSAAPEPSRQPTLTEGTVLGGELRRFAQISDSAADATRAWQSELQRVRAITGEPVISAAGHQYLVCFAGAASSQRALAAASALATSPRDEGGEAPALALACGSMIVAGSERTDAVILGGAVQQVVGLLREALPGEVVLGRTVQAQLEADKLGGLLTEQRGLFTSQPLYRLSISEARALATQMQDTEHAQTQALETPRGVPLSLGTTSRLSVGAALGERYEIVGELGKGGMGVVYKALDKEVGDLVALKMLLADLTDSPDQLDGLKSELRLARKITHPNVVRTFDLGEIDQRWFISMEFVQGLTLRYVLKQAEPVPMSAALRLVRQICAGLSAAHQQGVLHLDIKPENVIVEPNGNAKLMDFGIARRFQLEPAKEEKLRGTPYYLSPEQIEGQSPDVRSDIYALGIVMYELFTGSLPFRAKTPMQVLQDHLNATPTPPRELRPQISEELEAVILRCLAKRPEDRFATVAELQAALENC